MPFFVSVLKLNINRRNGESGRRKKKLNMNKTEFVEAVAKTSGLTKADAGRAVAAAIEVVTKALKKGEAVQITGFGTFEVQTRPARTGRNPQTGETVKIAARNAVTFKAGSALKEAVNK